MWIKKITLEKFLYIWTGLKVKKISIDFSNRENVMCLLVGPNGIGKTSFLSCLTPFATLGNLDVRDSNSLIIDGENGYKELIIMDDDDEYIIKHFYVPHKESNHSVKSYFTKNGVELNSNGNVTSFKCLVKEFFGIDMDYLKLIRIGDNVTNLIKLKATDRKNFMSKFLSSVDIYLKYNKKITEDVKDIKLIISHSNDKLQKLHIDDANVFKENINILKDKVEENDKELRRVRSNLSRIDFQLQTLGEGQKREDIKILIREKKKLLDKWSKSLESKKDISLDSVKREKLLKDNELQRLKGISEGNLVVIESMLNHIDSLYKELTSLKKNLELSKSESNIDSLEKYIQTLHNKRTSLEETLTFSKPTQVEKEIIDEFIVAIKNIQRILNTTYEFGKEPIKDALELIIKSKNINEYVASKLIAIEKKKKKDEATYLDKIIEKYSNIKRPDNCDCILLRMYDDIMMVKDIRSSDSNTIKNAEYYQMVKAVYDNLLYCFEELERWKEVIKQLPENIQKDFILDNLHDNIRNCKMIYNDKKINDLLLEVTEFYNYEKIIKELEKAFDDLRKEKETSKIYFFEDSIKRTTKLIEDKIKEKEKQEKIIHENNSDILNLETEIDNLSTLIDALEKYSETKKEYDLLIDKDNEIEKLLCTMDDCFRVESQLKKEKDILSKEIQDREFYLNEYNTLTKELKKAQEIYDDLITIKTSTSNKDGIPLLFIEMYLKDITELANELLDIVYGGDIYLDKFDIQADSFKIPFVKNGIRVPDISLASQGEQSFFSMAISFALSSKNLTKYNIPLLDEVDATFDTFNRERCLEIIEYQNEIIECEQEFIISHNNMYEQYSVDVIDFSNLKKSKFNIITE